MSKESIRVFHYQDSRSNKYWAVDLKPVLTGVYGIWYGAASGSKLTSKTVPDSPSVSRRIQDKLDKGYIEKPDLTIDRESGRVIDRGSVSDENVRDALWYTFTDPGPEKIATMRKIVSTFLIQLESQLKELDSSEYEALLSNQTYQSLQSFNQGVSGEEIDYSDGPLAALLLFGLRRHLRTYSDPEMALSVVGDDGFHMPPKFEEMDSLIASMFKALSDKQETDSRDLSHYGLQPTIEKLAIAFGCIDAPIIMSEIETNVEAAFF